MTGVGLADGHNFHGHSTQHDHLGAKCVQLLDEPLDSTNVLKFTQFVCAKLGIPLMDLRAVFKRMLLFQQLICHFYDCWKEDTRVCVGEWVRGCVGCVGGCACAGVCVCVCDPAS